MIVALLLAAALASPSPAAPAAPAPVASPEAIDEVSRALALRGRYDALLARVNEATGVESSVRDALSERVFLGVQTAEVLAKEPGNDILEDLERRADLDESLAAAFLAHAAPSLSASPGAHVGIARSGNRDEPFAYWVPAGYDPAKPGPLVVLFHAALQPETDWIARSYLRQLADATGAIVLAPGGNDRDPAQMVRSLDAAERALRTAAAWKPELRYVGGFSNGVFSAFHAVAALPEATAGFLAIAGFMLPADARTVGTRLSGRGAYLVTGSADDMIPVRAVREAVRTLRREHVYARLYEVAGAPHTIRAIYPAVTRAWRDMLGGVKTIDKDGYGTVSAAPKT